MPPVAYRARRTRPRSSLRRLLDLVLALALLAALALTAGWLNGRRPGTSGAHVIVNDGDSLTIGKTRVRLWGIDAPEFKQTCTRDIEQFDCGREARNHLRSLINGKSVECSNEGEDRYGRMLSICRVGGVSLNAEQVRAGWAVSYGGFHSEEAEARARKRGVWAGAFERPGDWRRTHQAPHETTHEAVGSVAKRMRDFVEALW